MSILTTGGSAGRRAVTLVLAAVAVAVLAVGGSLLPAQPAPYRASPLPVVGRTNVTCAPAVVDGARTYLAAAAWRQAPGREGRLSATEVGGRKLSLDLTEQGTARLVPRPTKPVIVQGEGVMATAAAAMMFSRANSGSLTGVMAAPCSAPDTEQWFVGVGATTGHRTDLVLTNPDEGEAEVDLRFYGRTGLVVVPGSPGLVIEGRGSRTVSLDTLLQADGVQVEGPLTVAVRASRGRVSATALDQRSENLQPRGADWQASSVAPTTRLVIPGVPEGAGQRQLVVVNPGSERAEVAVEILGVEGAFVPVGAEALVVPPESTVAVDLSAGLGQRAGNVRLTSTAPVTAAVQSLSAVEGEQPDLAVSPAVTPINRAGLVPLATVRGLESEFTLGNGGDTEARVSFEQFDYAGRSLRADDIVIIPGGSATRRLTAPSTSYLVVRAPIGSSVYGALTFSGDIGRAAGLANVTMTSPDQAGAAPQVRLDPSLGR